MAQSVTTDPRIDAYIAKTAPFAQPILQHWRRFVHSALPDEAMMIERLHAARDRVARSGSATKRPAARTPKPELTVPGELVAAPAANPSAQAKFDVFAPSHRHEHNEWIGEAKQVATRARRVAQSIMWIADGKKCNWKYENC